MAQDDAHTFPPSNLRPSSSRRSNRISSRSCLQPWNLPSHYSWRQSHPDRYKHALRLFRLQERKRSSSQTSESIRGRRTNIDCGTSQTFNTHPCRHDMPSPRQPDRTLLHIRPLITLPVLTRIDWSNLDLRLRWTPIPPSIPWSRRTNCRPQFRPGNDAGSVLRPGAQLRNRTTTRLHTGRITHRGRALDQRIPRHGRRQCSRKENPGLETWICQIHQRLCRNGRHSIHSHNPLRLPRNLLPWDYKHNLTHRVVEFAFRRKSDQNSPRKLQGSARNNPRECEHDISPPVLWSLGDSWICHRGRSRPLTLF